MIGSIPSPSFDGINLGPFELRTYGLMYVVGVIAAVAITTRRWEARGGSRELVHDVALWGFPAGLVGGRLYYLATSWNQAPDHWWGPLAVWQGGMGIWGGIALGTLVGIWRLHRAAADIPHFLDAAAPALLGLRLNLYVAGLLTAAGMLSFLRTQRNPEQVDRETPAPTAPARSST